MTAFFLLILAAGLFLAYRYWLYQKQRSIDNMASEAQASVSADIVEVLQQYKTLISTTQLSEQDSQQIQQQLKYLTENLFCDTDNERSVREFLMTAKQEIALLKAKITTLQAGSSPILTD